MALTQGKRRFALITEEDINEKTADLTAENTKVRLKIGNVLSLLEIDI